MYAEKIGQISVYDMISTVLCFVSLYVYHHFPFDSWDLLVHIPRVASRGSEALVTLAYIQIRAFIHKLVPARTRCNNDVIITSKWRRNVVFT